jgi:hypothetical protein
MSISECLQSPYVVYPCCCAAGVGLGAATGVVAATAIGNSAANGVMLASAQGAIRGALASWVIRRHFNGKIPPDDGRRESCSQKMAGLALVSFVQYFSDFGVGECVGSLAHDECCPRSISATNTVIASLFLGQTCCGLACCEAKERYFAPVQQPIAQPVPQLLYQPAEQPVDQQLSILPQPALLVPTAIEMSAPQIASSEVYPWAAYTSEGSHSSAASYVPYIGNGS